MANTFFLAQGVQIGKSLAEPDFAKTALEIMHAAKERRCEVVLPPDVVVAAKLEAGAPSRVVPRAGDAVRPDDPRRRPQGGGALHRRDRPLQDAAVERPARRLRGRPVRRGHVRAGARGGSGHEAGKLTRSPAAATPWPRSMRRASPTSSPTSRPRAARSSNGWRGARCPALPRWQCGSQACLRRSSSLAAQLGDIADKRTQQTLIQCGHVSQMPCRTWPQGGRHLRDTTLDGASRQGARTRKTIPPCPCV